MTLPRQVTEPRRAPAVERGADDVDAVRTTKREHPRDNGLPALRPVLPDFHVRVAQRDRLRVVEVEGEVDLLTAPRLATAMNDDHAFDTLVLDLGKVPFVGSAGLGVMMSLHQRLSRRGGGLALVAVQDHVAQILEITGLADTLVCAADVPAAISLLARAQTDA